MSSVANSQILICKMCGSERLNMENRRFNLVRCQNCGLVFAGYDYSDSDLRELYPRLYSPGGAYQQHLDELEDLRKRGASRLCFDKRTVLDSVMSFKPKLVFELGAGVGVVASYFKSQRVPYRGVEFNPAIAEAARTTGLDVVPGDHHRLTEFGEQADTLVAFEVIEHVPDIRECLSSIRDCLQPEGVLGITVPNYDKRLNGPGGEQIHQHPPPIHLNFWTIETLSSTLKRAGFVPLFIRERRRPYLALGYPAATIRSYFRFATGRFHGPVLICVARRRC